MSQSSKLMGIAQQANAERDVSIYYGYLDKAKKKRKADKAREKAARKRNRKKKK